MTDTELQQLSHEIVHEISGKRNMPIQAVFYPSRSLNHRIKMERGKIHIHIAEAMRSAPHAIIRALLIILVLKLYRRKVDRRLYRIYREYLESNAHQLPQPQKRPPNARYTPVGTYFNLNDIFDRMNRTYFNGQLPRPILGWSLRKAYRRLGFFNKEKNLLVISRIFDSPKTPPYVLEYLMYHEMLHIAIPVVHRQGRRTVHGKTFRQREREFPHYQRVQAWLNKNLPKL